MGQNKALKLVVKISLFAVPLAIITMCLFYNIIKIESELSGYANSTVIINEVVADNLCGIENEYNIKCDWIELYNCTDKDISLDGYSLLDSNEDSETKFNNITIKAKEHLIIYADSMESYGTNIHANFSVGASGDVLMLKDFDGNIIDKMVIPEVDTDMSYGRRKGSLDDLGIFAYATPGYDNQYEFLLENKGYITDVDIEFSHESGFYDDSFDLSLSCSDSNAIILYTLDGSEPNMNSNLYIDPINITERRNDDNKYVSSLSVPFEAGIYESYATKKVSKSNVIRARVYKDGRMSEKIWTKNYFVNKQYKLPIISISVSPYKMFDKSEGIYMPGKLYFFSQRMKLSDHYAYGNYSLNESLKSNVMVFDENGDLAFESDGKIKLAGNSGRQTSILKNLRFSNSEKDIAELYEVLETGYISDELSIKGTGGWPTYNNLYQNAYINNAIYDMNIGAQKNTLSVTYMDGEFWGIYSISEQKNEEYFKEHYNVDTDKLVLVDNGELKYGNSNNYSEYIELYKEFAKRDFSNDAEYEWAKSKVDIDNYIEYMICMMYFDNLDWPDNNVVVWKSMDNSEEYNDGKWRFFIYDMDHTFEDYDSNSFERVMNFDITDDNKHIMMPVIMLKKMWMNQQFRQDFVDKMDYLLNNELSKEKLLSAFEQHIKKIKPYINENIDRINGNGTLLYNVVLSKLGDSNEESYDSWYSDVKYVQEFINNRDKKIKSFIEDYGN